MSLEAMKMALEALEGLVKYDNHGMAYGEQDAEGLNAITALRQAIEQAEKQERVDAVNMKQERVDETAKGGHEPVGYINGIHGGYMVFTPLNPSAVYLNGTALYTAPPQREWVGLTDDEMRDLKQKSVDDGMTRVVSDFEYIRSIEAKLKEKNA
jgi:hypothetical protein